MLKISSAFVFECGGFFIPLHPAKKNQTLGTKEND